MIDDDTDFVRKYTPQSGIRVKNWRVSFCTQFHTKVEIFKKKLSVSESSVLLGGGGDEWGEGVMVMMMMLDGG